MSSPQVKHLKDYQAPEFCVDQVDLQFDLQAQRTVVHNRMLVHRAAHAQGAALRLDGGDGLTLERLVLDGRVLGPQDYQLDAGALVLAAVPDSFVLDITTVIEPEQNTSLMGLYVSGGNFFTQCEPEGFRKITYFIDRPDVMARYSTTLVADKQLYPVLLSNGNKVGEGSLEHGRHWAKWVDPFRKPSYLFALVAGRLDCLRDGFITASGREVSLEIYARSEDLPKCHHAMASLKRAMAWDEQVYGREYDLDTYMIVAVGDFNMGAMENKGLNIFNTKFVLASPETATDDDFDAIEAVIAHEYFHNWTGNRVTCRDWFQLSLKEGLTVYRDQEFSADMSSRAVKRIEDVRHLRAYQFPEDAGPMAHPVRPESYVEINNFYTTTVYEKGAEVVRMLAQLLGPQTFRAGTDLYFQRYDGMAVTTDDWLSAMEQASGRDLSQFKRWYSQAGTPVLQVRSDYDAQAQTYHLQVRQSCPATAGQTEKQAFVIPLRLALLGQQGQALPLHGPEGAEGALEWVLPITQTEQTVRFEHVSERPTPSLLRGFSAPVNLDYPHSEAELLHLLAHDGDAFSRWEAGQSLLRQAILQQYHAEEGLERPWSLALSEALRLCLLDERADPALRAQVLQLPSMVELAVAARPLHPERLLAAREKLRQHLALSLAEHWWAMLDRLQHPVAGESPAQAQSRRALLRVVLAYLGVGSDSEIETRCMTLYQQASTMTERMAALAALNDRDCQARYQMLADFYQRFQEDALVVDKWLALQAQSTLPNTLAQVQSLLQHPAFNLRNPNKVRALLGSLVHHNLARFHRADGAGYLVLQHHVVELNRLNPQVASRLVSALNQWRHYQAPYQSLQQQTLQHIQATPELSPDVAEVVNKALAEAP